MTKPTKVFIIHGWTYNLDKWQPILPMLRADNIKPMLLKVPGLTAPSDKVWDIDGYVDWLDRQLQGEKSPIIIGHSNGGRIALNYLMKHPNRFRQLILIDAAGVPHQQASSRLKLAVLRVLSKLGKPFSTIPGVRKVFYRLICANDYYQAPATMKKTMQNMLAANKTIDFSKITTPTTLIWGSEDQQTPLADGEFMAKAITGAKLHTIDDARHAPMFTHPETVAKLINEAVKA